MSGTGFSKHSTELLLKSAHNLERGVRASIDQVVADSSPGNIAHVVEGFTIQMALLGGMADELHRRGVHFESDLV